jgi:acyl CoA:acetate/3-ketoacid CoA transferase alpha subunit
MAMAADTVIAEVEEIVPAGSLDPECIVTPHIYVDVLTMKKN